MARGRSTATRTQARETARARKARADAERRHRDQIEERAVTEFEIARVERDAADQRAAEQVQRLDGLPGMRTDRIALLLDETPAEIKRLRKLAASTPEEDDAVEDPSAANDGGDAAASEARADGDLDDLDGQASAGALAG